MKVKGLRHQFTDGLFTQNPLLVQVLGVCASLAVTTSVSNSFYMGIAVTAVLTCSNLLISLLRKIIPAQVRIASYIVIISGFVTVVEMLMKAYLPSAAEKLGIFLPLIVVNCIILGRAEAFASKNAPLPSLIDGLAMGAGFALALLLLGAIRELLGAGTLLGFSILGKNYTPIGILSSPPGAFIVLGCLIALMQYLKKRLTLHQEKTVSVKASEEKAIEENKEERA